MSNKILYWDKPPKAMSSEQWTAISADSAPPGVYTPNMSPDDMQRWKAKLVGVRTDYPTVEIRKTAGMSQVLIVVSLGGFAQSRMAGSKIEYLGMNVKISQNGSAYYSWEDLADFQRAIDEAKQVLLELAKK